MSTAPAAPAPLCAYDADGKGGAVLVGDLGTPCADAWRWLHFDMNTEGLTEWLTAQLPPLVVEHLLASETRPRVQPYAEGLMLNLRGVNLNEGDAPEDMISLRVWATKDLVITVRRRRIFAIDDLRRAADGGALPRSTGHFLDAVIEGLVERIETVTLALDDVADGFEEAVYDGEAHSLPELGPLQRQVIKLRRHLSPQTRALVDLAVLDSPLIAEELRDDLRQSANRAERSDEELSEVRDRLNALTSHLEALRDARMGRNSYILSAIAAIFLPLGFLTGLFGVNLGGLPGTDSQSAFAILCVSMVVIALAGFAFLRWKRWL